MKEIKLIMERWKKFLLQEFDPSPIITAGPKMSDPGYEPPSPEAVKDTVDALKSVAAAGIEVVDAVDTAGTVVAVYLSGGTLLPVMISKQGAKQVLKKNLLNALKSTRESPKNIANAVKQQVDKFKIKKKNPNLPDLKAPAPRPKDRPQISATNIDDLNKDKNLGSFGEDPTPWSSIKGDPNVPLKPIPIDDTPLSAPKIRLGIDKKSRSNSDVDPFARTDRAIPDNSKTVIDGPPEQLVGPKPRKTKPKGSKLKDRTTEPQGSK